MSSIVAPRLSEESCTDAACNLSLKQAQQEIIALDHTVGDLVVEIMDMLSAVSAFRRGQAEVSSRPPCSLHLQLSR